VIQAAGCPSAVDGCHPQSTAEQGGSRTATTPRSSRSIRDNWGPCATDTHGASWQPAGHSQTCPPVSCISTVQPSSSSAARCTDSRTSACCQYPPSTAIQTVTVAARRPPVRAARARVRRRAAGTAPLDRGQETRDGSSRCKRSTLGRAASSDPTGASVYSCGAATHAASAAPNTVVVVVGRGGEGGVLVGATSRPPPAPHRLRRGRVGRARVGRVNPAAAVRAAPARGAPPPPAGSRAPRPALTQPARRPSGRGWGGPAIVSVGRKSHQGPISMGLDRAIERGSRYNAVADLDEAPA